MVRRERASVVCVEGDRLLAVLMTPPGAERQVFLPGGGREPGETPAETAAREVAEETGYDVIVDQSRQRTARYQFRWGETLYDNTTHFFPARLADPTRSARAVRDELAEGVAWIPLADVRRTFGHHPEILREIVALLPRAEFRTFAAFWPHYVREHAHPCNRRLHGIGSTLVLALLAGAVLAQRWWLLASLPVCGYGFAWYGHFVVEKNRPATFANPVYSLLADFKMLALMATGRMDEEVARAREPHSPGKARA